MGDREAASSTRGRAGRALAVAALLAASVAACGEEDFANQPRPATPVEVTAAVNDKKVVVSPRKLGAGLANFTVSNQSPAPVRLTLVGPGPQGNAESGEVPPGGVGNLKTELTEGDYEVTAGSHARVQPAQLSVGPPRKSSKNELLPP